MSRVGGERMRHVSTSCFTRPQRTDFSLGGEPMSELQANVIRRPMTGDEYLESLRGPRDIWIYGERVQDVTTHPAFRNAARMIARLYDALHDPALQDVLTTETDTGSGSR